MRQIYRCPACMEAIHHKDDVCSHCGFTFNASDSNPNHLVPGTYLLHGCYLVGNVLCTSDVSVTYLGFDTKAKQIIMLTEFMPTMLVIRQPSSSLLMAKSAVASSEFAAVQIRYTSILQQAITLGNKRGVINVINVFQDNGTVYAVSEVSQESLSNGSYSQIESLRISELDFEELSSVKTIVKMLEDVFNAVEEYNSAGLFICGISPNTLVCTKYRHAELMLAEALAVSACSGSSFIDPESAFIANECYASNKKIGAYSDVYSFAAVIYRLCFSQNPQTAHSRLEDSKLSFPESYSNSLAKWRKNALINAMNIPIHARTQSVAQLYDELYSNKIVMCVNVISAHTAKSNIAKKNTVIIVASICVFLMILFAVASKRILNRSNGNSVVIVPNFIDKNLDEVRTEADQNDLSLQIIGRVYSDKIDRDRVCSQYPEVGQNVHNGSIIQIILSAGKNIEMPKVEGLSLDSAKQKLEDLGIKYIIVEEYSNAIEQGLIIAQSIKADSDIEEDVEVKLTVSLGREQPIPTPTPTPEPTKKSKATPVPATVPSPEAIPTSEQIVDSGNINTDNNKKTDGNNDEEGNQIPPAPTVTPTPVESPTSEPSSTPMSEDIPTAAPTPEESPTTAPTPEESQTTAPASDKLAEFPAD